MGFLEYQDLVRSTFLLVQRVRLHFDGMEKLQQDLDRRKKGLSKPQKLLGCKRLLAKTILDLESEVQEPQDKDQSEEEDDEKLFD